MLKLKKVIVSIDISKQIANHLMGEQHTPIHRKVIGVCIMCIGVVISKAAIIFNITYIHIIFDIVGYAIHGIGLTLFIINLETSIKDKTHSNSINSTTRVKVNQEVEVK